ncbi:MAG: AAA family ATPase, partial [Dehalococcoidia bacterium]|nr:AAA family ATPase [Dehalococcoidia bacterium]
MRQLVVLVGLPGSGKTSFRERHPKWAVVSKDDIRRTVFHRDFDLDYEDAVERIFTAALVETVQSSAQVVCVDSTNLTR